MSSPAGIEKCFEEAEDSGVLKVNHKGLKCFPTFVEEYDLVDVLTVGKYCFFCYIFSFMMPKGHSIKEKIFWLQ